MSIPPLKRYKNPIKASRLFFLSIFLAISSTCFAFVHDNAHMLQDSDKKKIEEWVAELEQKTSAQIAVVTINNLNLTPIEEYAVNLFKKLGIGQKAKDNGILLLVAKKERQLRIEVGYGLEEVLTDAIANQIINRVMVPEFKEGHYSEGILKGTWEITSLIAKEAHVNVLNPPQSTESAIPIPVLAFPISIYLLLFLLNWKLRRYRGKSVGSSHTISSKGSGRGGYGGGRSGGGGASGRW